MTILAFFAAESADPAVPGLVSYGGVGILALALLYFVRELWAREKQNADYLKQRLEASEAEVRRLNAEIQSNTLPAVVKATEVMGQLATKVTRRGSP